MPMLSRHTYVTSALMASFLGFSAAAVQGCDDGGGPLGGLAEKCGLTCEADAFVSGQANVSGIASIDAFFGAAIDLNASMKGLSGSLRAELDAIGASVGLEPGAAGADIKAAIQAKIAANVEGGLSIQYDPPKCEANIDVAVSAAAECDVEVDPGMVSVKCEGSCKAEAGVMVDCGAEAELKCTGTAPNLACEGECSGSCVADFTAAASCEGTCRGSCTAGGSTMDGFEGKCNGMCMGECAVEVSGGASCMGKCEGECTYTPPSAMCDASAEAHCDAMAGGSVECSGGCEGKAEPPMVSAECEASVKAKADASIECTPPSLKIAFNFSADLEGDLDAQAEFRAWLEGFRGHFAALLALRAKGDIVIEAAGNLAASAGGAVSGAVDELSGSADLSASIGAACALEQLPVAGQALTSASGELAGNVSATVDVLGAIGG